MRTGLIAQKLGMTRLFNDEGEHVPGDRAEGRQVPGRRRAHRREDGYTAVQLGVGKAKVEERRPSRCAAISPRRRSSRSARWSSSASSADALLEVGAELAAEHFVAGQFVDVVGTTHRQGLRRRR